jgi:hypothetical protein
MKEKCNGMLTPSSDDKKNSLARFNKLTCLESCPDLVPEICGIVATVYTAFVSNRPTASRASVKGSTAWSCESY